VVNVVLAKAFFNNLILFLQLKLEAIKKKRAPLPFSNVSPAKAGGN